MHSRRRGVAAATLPRRGHRSCWCRRVQLLHGVAAGALGIDAVLSNELEIERGRLTGRVVGGIVDGVAKAARLRSEIDQLGIAREQAVAIGDGANDIPMMTVAGISVAYRAKPIVREHATHALDYAGLDGVLNLFV